ncbi:nitric oxide associated protein 1, partial [Spiromyces aspiralis]
MLSPTDSLTLPPADMAAKADQKPTLDSISKKNKLTDKEFEAMAMAIDNSELRDLFVLPRDEKSVRDGDPNPTGAVTRQPASTLESDSSSPECEPKPANRKPVVCQRCHSLIHYNRLASDHSGMTANPSGASHRSQPVLPWKANVITDPRALQFLKYERNALIIVVCDIFDIPGSLIPNLGQFIGSNVLELAPPSKAPPRLETATAAQDVDGKSNDSGSRPRRRRVLLVANKSDLLPEDAHLDRIKSQWLKPLVRKALGSTLSITSYHIVSSRKNLGIRELAQDIRKYRRPQDNVFLVGRANVGKSELLNALLRISVLESAGSYRGTVTTANVPGTTIGVHGIPLDKFNRALVEPGTSMSTMGERRFVYDTPGIFNSKSILNFLTFDELKLAVPTNRIRPATYIVKTGKCVCLGGLGRVDVLPPSDIADETDAGVVPRIQQQYLLVTVFSALKPHITSIEKADTLFRNLREGRRTVLIPPLPVDSERQRHYPPLNQGLEFV